MQLSPNFSLNEMIRSNTASRLGISNMPDPSGILRLVAVCTNILEPVRAHFGKPVRVNSGYRSLELNAHVPGSAKRSQHTLCEAADYEIDGVSNVEIAKWVRDNLKFDQLILEAHTPGIANSGWVHTSWTDRHPARGLVETMTPSRSGPFYSTGIRT